MSLGCNIAFDPTKEDATEKIKELTEGRGANIVFNTISSPQIARDSVKMTSPGGICVMFSSIHPNEPVEVNMGIIHSYQKTITGAVSPTIQSYNQAVLMISKGIVDPTNLIEEIFNYKDFDKAMETAMNPDTYKVILKFGEI